MSRANVAVVRRLNDEVLNGGRIELIPEIFAADFVSNRRGMPSVARLLGAAIPAGSPLDQLSRRFAGLRLAFPDWRSEIRDLVADGDLVAVRYALSGTHRGPLFGAAPTGRSVSLDEVVFYRFVHSRIQEDWAMGDELALLVQLGLTDRLAR